MEKMKRPAAGGTAATGMGQQQREPHDSATPRKWQRTLKAFVDGRSLNRWEAARALRDWCLPSTVAELQARGVMILRKDEIVTGAFGPVRCCRYWLAPQSLQRARALLGYPEPSPDASACHNAFPHVEAPL